ncbi:DEAD/DEAH box helicase [Nonomuraea sp. NPDC003754]
MAVGAVKLCRAAAWRSRPPTVEDESVRLAVFSQAGGCPCSPLGVFICIVPPGDGAPVRQPVQGSGEATGKDLAASANRQPQRDRSLRWPHPWVSLNPSFASGGTITELIAQGVLHPACEQYFRPKSDENDPGARTIILHQHQREAVEAARDGRSYVLTTGTGSGKSLAYMVPIVDSILRDPAPGRVKAIVVYPMNALANSQLEELTRYLQWGLPKGSRQVSFERYTGQESEEQRARILARKPDILLTNYVMLEYLLTRPAERRDLIGAAQGLCFLVLDELHTYRGRQGADVSLLVRRLRDACMAP